MLTDVVGVLDPQILLLDIFLDLMSLVVRVQARGDHDAGPDETAAFFFPKLSLGEVLWPYKRPSPRRRDSAHTGPIVLKRQGRAAAASGRGGVGRTKCDVIWDNGFRTKGRGCL